MAKKRWSSALMSTMERVTAQRDELLAALKAVVPVKPDEACRRCGGWGRLRIPEAYEVGIECPDCQGRQLVWSDAAKAARALIERIEKEG